MRDARAMTLVLRSDVDSVATLTLNRPEKLNAITPEMLSELRAHVDDLARDSSIGCVVLAGAGRCFGAGHDLGAIGQEGSGPDRHVEAETVDALEALPQVTMARIHGYCFTGSLELALACDLLVAGESAELADTHGKWGLVPIWGMSVRLPERVGFGRAKEMAFTGRRVSGAEALAIGLVDRCVPDESVEAAAAELAADVVANSWGTNQMTKQLYADQASMTRQAALQYERTRPYGMPLDHEARRPH
jgi:enoyl-CoA hydratase